MPLPPTRCRSGGLSRHPQTQALWGPSHQGHRVSRRREGFCLFQSPPCCLLLDSGLGLLGYQALGLQRDLSPWQQGNTAEATQV